MSLELRSRVDRDAAVCSRPSDQIKRCRAQHWIIYWSKTNRNSLLFATALGFKVYPFPQFWHVVNRLIAKYCLWALWKVSKLISSDRHNHSKMCIFHNVSYWCPRSQTILEVFEKPIWKSVRSVLWVQQRVIASTTLAQNPSWLIKEEMGSQGWRTIINKGLNLSSHSCPFFLEYRCITHCWVRWDSIPPTGPSWTKWAPLRHPSSGSG